jgi:hypothetical protein
MSSLILVIRFDKGLATRRRLPLDHVLSVLGEVRSMIEEAGRVVQKEGGVEKPTGDFGLELVGGFQPGSLVAPIAITRDVQHGRVAAEKVLRAIKWVEGVPSHRTTGKEPEMAPQVVKHLNRIAKIQKADKTEMHLELRGGRRKSSAAFTEAGIAAMDVLRAPQFEMEGVSLYGKLYELRDSSPEEEEGRFFWGELCRDNGERWRVRFNNADTDKVTRLFKKQVVVTGKAVYYRAQTPKVIAQEIALDTERDYESAFDELYGCNKELYGADLKTLLREIRGDA